MKLLNHFKWAIGISVVVIVGMGVSSGISLGVAVGLATAFLVFILGVLEFSVSFDNAVVNSKILERMSPKWQRLFLSVGIIIAVFGMRLIFPLLVVMVTTGLNPVEVVVKAIEGGSAEEPGTYANLLTAAHPDIVSFGGTFLLMLTLDYFFEYRDVVWLHWIERPLAKAQRFNYISVMITLVVIIVTSIAFPQHTDQILFSGLIGLVTYIVVKGLSTFFEQSEDEEVDAVASVSPKSNTMGVVGKAAFFLFLYLEVLDASFSFDGVIGAFAISNNVFIIAAGLGIGAFWVRSLTVLFVRQKTLAEFRYLEHGAHWAIAALAVIMFVSIGVDVPEIVTGSVGIVFIGAAFIHSYIVKKREEREALATEPTKEHALQSV